MHRAERHLLVDLDPFPWTGDSRWPERPCLPIDRDTQALLRRGLHAHATALTSGDSHQPPRSRGRRPTARTWRSSRSARFSIEARRGGAPRRRDEREPRDRRAGALGVMAGALLGALALRSASAHAFRPEWLVATVPLITLWASVGGLVAISVARAARGHEPLPELAVFGPLGERRSLARPVAVGLVIGGLVVAALRAAIALSAWLPVTPQG